MSEIHRRKSHQNVTAREHWIQHITFAAETNAACTAWLSGQTHRCQASQYLLHLLSSDEGNDDESEIT